MDTEETKKYYYNDSGQLSYEESYVNGKVHGMCRGWHGNGQLSDEHPCLEGNSHGIRKYWHDNGQISDELPYKKGQINGICKRWNKNGQLMFVIALLNGKDINGISVYLNY